MEHVSTVLIVVTAVLAGLAAWWLHLHGVGVKAKAAAIRADAAKTVNDVTVSVKADTQHAVDGLHALGQKLSDVAQKARDAEQAMLALHQAHAAFAQSAAEAPAAAAAGAPRQKPSPSVAGPS